MDRHEFVLRVRGATEVRIFRFSGAEAADLHRMHAGGTFERPGGTQRLSELVRGRKPDEVLTGGANNGGSDAHFDMVDDDELGGYLSNRLMERRGAAEGGGGSQGARDTPGSATPNTPSP